MKEGRRRKDDEGRKGAKGGMKVGRGNEGREIKEGRRRKGGR